MTKQAFNQAVYLVHTSPEYVLRRTLIELVDIYGLPGQGIHSDAQPFTDQQEAWQMLGA